MAETLTIRTASSTEVVKIAVPGPQGPKGDKGDPGDVAGLPLTTQGDTLYRGASENQRLPIGTTGQVLKVSAGGIPEWGNESGAVTEVNGQTGAVTLTASDVGAAPSTGIDPAAITGTAVVDNDARLSDSRTPTSHAASHAAAGSDPVSPSSIGAQSIFELAFTATNVGTLTASRAKIWTLIDFTNSSYNLKLPRTNAQVGDIVVIRLPSIADWGANSQVTIGYDFEDTPGVPDFFPLVTISTKGVQYRYQCTVANSFGASYSLIDVDTHTHAAADITSGNFGNISFDGKVGSTSGLPLVTTTAGAVTTLALGTANQVLKVNSGATGVEFGDASGGVTAIGASAADILSVSGSDIVADDLGADKLYGWDDSAGKAIGFGVVGPTFDGTNLRWPVELVIACSDETTDLTTGTAKVTFRAPYAFLLTGVRASVNTAPTGSTLIVDINNGANSALSTKLSIDASEKTSTTAATAAAIDTSYDDFSDDAEITIDIDQIGSTVAGKGLKVTLIGTRA